MTASTADYRVWVKPGSRKGPLIESAPEGIEAELVVFVRERAVDGKANLAVERAIAQHFDVSKSQVRITRGHTSRIKVVRVDHS